MSCLPLFLTIPAIQRELGITRDQVTSLIQTGALPAFQIFGEWRVERVMLDRMVDRLYAQEATDHQAGEPEGPVPPPVPPAASTSPSASQVATGSMTGQQRRIAYLIAQGLSNADIAQRLCLEASTVKSHVSRILLRLNLGSRQQLIAELWRSGFMAGEEGRMTG